MNVLQFDQKSKFIDQSFTQSVPSLYAVHIEDVKLIFFFNFRDLPEFLDKCPLKKINPILLGKEKFVLHPKVIPIRPSKKKCLFAKIRVAKKKSTRQAGNQFFS